MISIIPLNLGIGSADQSSFTYRQNIGKKIDISFIAYCILGSDKTILVDTGPGDPERAKKFHHPIIQNEEHKLPNALKKIGLNTRDIDIVINTHLHWDHCSSNNLFKGAEFIVQRRELQYAVAPAPIFNPVYEVSIPNVIPEFLKTKFSLVEGNKKINDDISLLCLPGHTPGMQGVLVKSGSKKIMIASDAIPLFENWKNNPKIPCGVFTNLESCYKSYIKIERITELILPGHDLQVFNKESYP